MRLDRAVTFSRYIVLIGVVGLILASLVGFLLSLLETAEVIGYVALHFRDPTVQVQEVYFIKLVDGFLVATGLLIFALGLFEIFIRELKLPKALQFTTIGQLKVSLANVIVLTLGVSFLTLVQESEPAFELLLKGLAISAVIVTLVFFTRGDHME